MRHTSWYICFHSAIGSTLTSTSVRRSAPSPAFTGAVAETMTYCGPAAPAAAPTAPASGAAAHAQQHLLAVGGKVERRSRCRPVSPVCAALRSYRESVAPPAARAASAGRSPSCRRCPRVPAVRPYTTAPAGAARRCAARCWSKSMRTGLGGVLAAAAPLPRPPRPPRPPSLPACRRRSVGALFFIALRRQRRGDVVGQHRQVDAAGHLVLVAGHVEAALAWGRSWCWR